MAGARYVDPHVGRFPKSARYAGLAGHALIATFRLVPIRTALRDWAVSQQPNSSGVCSRADLFRVDQNLDVIPIIGPCMIASYWNPPSV